MKTLLDAKWVDTLKDLWHTHNPLKTLDDVFRHLFLLNPPLVLLRLLDLVLLVVVAHACSNHCVWHVRQLVYSQSYGLSSTQTDKICSSPAVVQDKPTFWVFFLSRLHALALLLDDSKHVVSLSGFVDRFWLDTQTSLVAIIPPLSERTFRIICPTTGSTSSQSGEDDFFRSFSCKFRVFLFEAFWNNFLSSFSCFRSSRKHRFPFTHTHTCTHRHTRRIRASLFRSYICGDCEFRLSPQQI